MNFRKVNNIFQNIHTFLRHIILKDDIKLNLVKITISQSVSKSE